MELQKYKKKYIVCQIDDAKLLLFFRLLKDYDFSFVAGPQAVVSTLYDTTL